MGVLDGLDALSPSPTPPPAPAGQPFLPSLRSFWPAIYLSPFFCFLFYLIPMGRPPQVVPLSLCPSVFPTLYFHLPSSFPTKPALVPSSLPSWCLYSCLPAPLPPLLVGPPPPARPMARSRRQVGFEPTAPPLDAAPEVGVNDVQPEVPSPSVRITIVEPTILREAAKPLAPVYGPRLPSSPAGGVAGLLVRIAADWLSDGSCRVARPPARGLKRLLGRSGEYDRTCENRSFEHRSGLVDALVE